MTRNPTAPDGLLIVDKPPGWTSHDVVGKTRWLAGTRKVGHAGTLDPMATGVLVLGIGRGTKLLTFLVGCDKDYDATIRLGATTITDDAEGEIVATADATGLDHARIESVIETLTGDIDQVPSAVSAIKIDGQRSYARVRAGEEVDLAARPVRVERFVVSGRPRTAVDAPGCLDLDVSVTVSSGTYVRALARDLGKALGVGGHLTALRRTRVGGYPLDRAHTLTDLEAFVTAGSVLPVLPLAEAAVAALPSRVLTEAQARSIGFGQRVDSAEPGRAEPVAALDEQGTLIAILDESASTTRSHVVFAPSTS